MCIADVSYDTILWNTSSQKNCKTEFEIDKCVSLKTVSRNSGITLQQKQRIVGTTGEVLNCKKGKRVVVVIHWAILCDFEKQLRFYHKRKCPDISTESVYRQRFSFTNDSVLNEFHWHYVCRWQLENHTFCRLRDTHVFRISFLFYLHQHFSTTRSWPGRTGSIHANRESLTHGCWTRTIKLCEYKFFFCH